MRQRGFWEGLDLNLMVGGKTFSTPKISEDGSKISFIGDGLQLYDLVTGELSQLTDKKLSTGTPYGGGTYCWGAKEIIFSSNGKLYTVAVEGGTPRQITFEHLAYAPVTKNGIITYCLELPDKMVLEVRIGDKVIRPDLPFDFIYDPDISPDGDIAFHAWSFPNMSWNYSGIYIIRLNKHNELIKVAEGEFSTCQPRYSPNGSHLAFISDESGWWNLWISDKNGGNRRQITTFSNDLAYSTWTTGASNYQWISEEEIVFTRYVEGDQKLEKINIQSGEVTELATGGEFKSLSYSQGTLVFERTDIKTKNEICTIQEGKLHTLLRSGLVIPPTELSKIPKPIHMEFPTEDENAYGLLFARPDQDGEVKSCPTIFLIHGGPTGFVRNYFKLDIAFWTAKGWAVFAVNHRGSAGYGRKFRESMNGKWGVYDVQDTVSALNFLVKKGVTDPKKTVIMGGSAGGYTTLMTMALYPGIMKAGVNLYGVTDLFGLSEETHFLESQYDTTLVGPLPEASEEFFRRSPIHLAENITDPLLVLQGSDDPVVLKNQSDRIVEKVRGPVEYKVYEGEGHGFQKPETLKDMFKRIDKFLRMHVLYTYPDDLKKS